MLTPVAEIDLNPQLVRRLLQDQHAELTSLPIDYLAEGWDNTMYRLGKDLLIRLPRRELGATTTMNEQKWLASISTNLSIPVPLPKYLGLPTSYYPWHWHITNWHKGCMAAEILPNGEEAFRLADFFKGLHQYAPSNAPRNLSRSNHISSKSATTIPRLQQLQAGGYINNKIIQLWAQVCEVPAYEDDPRWLHGDAHPKNILVDNDRISAIIDWGDMCGGDPATDLAAFWMLFEVTPRRTALKRYGVDADTYQRALGWAIFFGAFLLEVGLEGDPLFTKVGQFTLRQVLLE